MQYVRVPRNITSADVLARGLSWSPSMYRRVEIPARKTKTVGSLLDGWDKGGDPGSFFYLPRSSHFLIRTKALQERSTLIYPKGDAITPLNPRVFESLNLSDGDILLSKDSNIGECAMVDGDGWKNHAISGGVVRLRPNIDRFYLFAFLKHPVFREQLYSLVPRGATIAHANLLWLDCRVPFPDQLDSARVERYVAALMEAIIEKERAIRERHATAVALIATELATGLSEPFQYSFPTPPRMLAAGRMDAGFWSSPLQASLHRLAKYKRGAWTSIYDAGFTTRRGPNLAVSVSGPAQYSDQPFGAALPLATPGDISDFMTLPKFRYYGNRRRVDTVRHAEMLFAGKGVREVSIGHTWINLGLTPFVTNFDSFLIHSPSSAGLVCLGFLLSYLKSTKVFAKLADTSNGGSFVKSHFRALPIPRFEEEFIKRIAKFYHSPAANAVTGRGLADFVAQHRARNAALGIWELDGEMKALQAELSNAQKLIFQGKTVKVPFPD